MSHRPSSTSQQVLIAAARARGSTATTWHGAARYLRDLAASRPRHYLRDLPSHALIDPTRLILWGGPHRGELQRAARPTWTGCPMYVQTPRLRPECRTRRDWRATQVAARYGPTGDPYAPPELAEMMRLHGPIPACRGAGELYEHVRYGAAAQTTPSCTAETVRGSSSGVARSYGYPVLDHRVTWLLPQRSTLQVIAGLVVCVPTDEHPEEAWIARKGRGYSGTWQRIDLSDARACLRQRDVHVRTVAITLYGPERLLAELGADRRVTRTTDARGTLIRIAGDAEDIVYVRVIDPSTTREYLLRVPPEIQTATAAVAWTYDVPPEQYAPAQET